MIWSSAVVTRLGEMAALGRSNQEIAVELGVSSGAVAGARFRYGLAKTRTPRPPEPPPLAVPEPPSMPGPFECKFILDNGPWRRRPPQWCLKRTLADSPYCPEHHARCYTTRPHGTGSK